MSEVRDFPPIVELLPHGEAFCLLSAMQSVAEEQVCTFCEVRSDMPMLDASGRLPSWVGVELMAQSIAAWSGWHAHQRGESVALGFLLGTRRFEASVSDWPSGTRLYVHCERQFRGANGLAKFDCQILDEHDTVQAKAALTVFEPDNPDAFIEGQEQ